MNKLILTPLTKTQKLILFLLYKFRFLTTYHLQTILNHKNPHRTQSWLKDLKEKGYIVSMYQRNVRSENTKSSVLYLTPLARHILKKDSKVELKALSLIYKEKKRTKKFINHCLLLADIYLYFLSQKKKKEKLQFFTKTTLTGYEYFPKPMPDAYIAIKDEKKTRRYFLDLFDEYTPPFVYRKRIKQYLDYSVGGDWGANTNKTLFPIILFVCPNESARKHVYWYGKNVIEKSFEEIHLYVTTIDTLKFSNGNTDIWQKVE